MTPNLLDELEGVMALLETKAMLSREGEEGSAGHYMRRYECAAADLLRTHAPALADMAKRMEAAESDSKRLDWLADRNNSIGQVLLPTASVEANLHDMRAAIDHAMNAAIDATQDGAG